MRSIVIRRRVNRNPLLRAEEIAAQIVEAMNVIGMGMGVEDGVDMRDAARRSSARESPARYR